MNAAATSRLLRVGLVPLACPNCSFVDVEGNAPSLSPILTCPLLYFTGLSRPIVEGGGIEPPLMQDSKASPFRAGLSFISGCTIYQLSLPVHRGLRRWR